MATVHLFVSGQAKAIDLNQKALRFVACFSLSDHLVACLASAVGPIFSDVTTSKDLRNHYGEYNLILTDRTNGWSYENNIQGVINHCFPLMH